MLNGFGYNLQEHLFQYKGGEASTKDFCWSACAALRCCSGSVVATISITIPLSSLWWNDGWLDNCENCFMLNKFLWEDRLNLEVEWWKLKAEGWRLKTERQKTKAETYGLILEQVDGTHNSNEGIGASSVMYHHLFCRALTLVWEMHALPFRLAGRM